MQVTMVDGPMAGRVVETQNSTRYQFPIIQHVRPIPTEFLAFDPNGGMSGYDTRTGEPEVELEVAVYDIVPVMLLPGRVWIGVFAGKEKIKGFEHFYGDGEAIAEVTFRSGEVIVRETLEKVAAAERDNRRPKALHLSQSAYDHMRREMRGTLGRALPTPMMPGPTTRVYGPKHVDCENCTHFDRSEFYGLPIFVHPDVVVEVAAR